ncbi:MAG TPA: alpha/beta hydrolase [Puia sp.]|nr:alpha/beta hydrolase [Puia sp.]
MKNFFAFLCIILLAVSNCIAQSQAKLPEKKLKDIAYGSFPSSKMDVYLPAGRNQHTPFVIVIHGGAWIEGDKSFDTPTQDSLLAHGIASANIDFRFIDSVVNHVQILADIDSAVDYCVAHAEEWGTRSNGFTTNGASAGGNLALLYGYTSNKKINAIVAECPPTDLADTATLGIVTKEGLLSVVEGFGGGKYTPGKPAPAGYADASPVYHLKNIPVLVIQGTADKVVPFSQSVELDKLLTEKDITHKFIPIKGADHDLNMRNPATRKMIYREFIAWVQKYGK